jgi:hypothetical protein
MQQAVTSAKKPKHGPYWCLDKSELSFQEAIVSSSGRLKLTSLQCHTTLLYQTIYFANIPLLVFHLVESI